MEQQNIKIDNNYSIIYPYSNNCVFNKNNTIYTNIQHITKSNFGEILLTQNNKNKIIIKKMPKLIHTSMIEIRIYIFLLNNKKIKKYIANIHNIYSDVDYYYIMMDYYIHYLDRDLIERKVLNKYKVVSIIKKILQFIKFMHMNRYIINDIKPENILLDNYLNPRLIDFGLVTRFNDISSNCKGTPYFISPESFYNVKITSNNKKDIWAIGMTLYEFMIDDITCNYITIRDSVNTGGEISFSEKIDVKYDIINSDINYMIQKIDTKKDFLGSEDVIIFKNIILRCLDINPDTRISINEILEYKIFK